jgi:hypothetical protein
VQLNGSSEINPFSGVYDFGSRFQEGFVAMDSFFSQFTVKIMIVKSLEFIECNVDLFTI